MIVESAREALFRAESDHEVMPLAAMFLREIRPSLVGLSIAQLQVATGLSPSA